jgi:YHS domain-containing protein
MTARFLFGSLALLGFFATSAVPADKPEPSKEALKALNEFVGQWKGNGETKSGKSEIWKESAEWSWDLKGTDPALKIKFTGGKQFSEGTLKYLPDKRKYQLTATTTDKKEQVFTGEIKSKKLVLTHEEPETKDKYTVEMSTNNDGARFVYNVAVQKKGVGIARRLVEVGLTREGVSLAGGKKNECIITGGLARMEVTYNGKTYYVCCTGCRDEFNANPKKYVDEYEKSKK